MPSTLTEAQRDKVNRNRRSPVPTYYNAKTQNRISISQDTEAAIILLPPEKRDQATKYFKLFAEREAAPDDYAEVFNLFLERQKDNVATANLSLETIFGQYNQFRDSLLGSGEDVLVSGLQQVFESLSLGLGNLKKVYDTLQYKALHLDAAQKVGVGVVTDEQKREIQSWIPVFVLYPF